MTNTTTSTSIAPTPEMEANSITLRPRNGLSLGNSASVDELEPHEVIPSSFTIMEQ